MIELEEGAFAAGAVVGCERSAVRGEGLETISHCGSVRVGFQGMLMLAEGLARVVGAAVGVSASASLEAEVDEMEEVKLSWEVGLAVRGSEVKVVLIVSCASVGMSTD